MTSKFVGFALFAAAVVVPSVAFAQTSSTGLLNVYVQVLNQTGYSYTPGNFTVTVNGVNPSPATFAGSNQGTKVSLNPGSYTVTAASQAGYTFGMSPSYSVGCSGTMAANETQTCVITVNAGNYWSYPYVSPYPYQYLPTPGLSCRTETPIVSMGQQARFTAVGGAGGTYNWATPFQNFPNVGPVLTTTFPSSGNHSVTVTNASQTATCTVTVNNSYYPQPTVPTSPVYPAAPAYVYPYGSPTYSGTYIAPSFPNTGFEPLSSAQMAFALVLIMGSAIAAYPYARKAFALALR